MTDESYDYGELLVIQHATHTGPSALTRVLDARAHLRPWRLADPSSGAAFPALEDVRGIIVLGGPMGVDDTADHPWLSDEIELLRRAADHDVPVFGICLGAQLLAVAGDGRVEERAVPEVGYLALHRTETAADDVVFAGWPDGSQVLFLHDDGVIELPQGAEVVLTGSDGAAAFRAGDGVSYGVQFHPEVDAAQVAAWTSREANVARCGRAGVDADALATEAQRRDHFHRAVGLSLVGRWLDQVVGADDPDPKRGKRARAAGSA